MFNNSDKKIPVAAPPPDLPSVLSAANGANPLHQVGLEDIWRRLLRQKALLLLTTLAVLLLTAYITWSTTPSYRSFSTVQIEKEGAQIVNFGALNSASPDMGDSDPFFRTQYEQLKSRKLAEQVIDELGLEQHLFGKQTKPGILQSLKQMLKDVAALASSNDGAKPNPPSAPDSVKRFLDALYVEPIEKTHLVKVYYESPDPVLSAQIVNSLVGHFIKDNINAHSETDNYAKQFLEKELETARQHLNDQEIQLVDYAKKNNILEVNNSQSTQEKKLDDLYSALGEAQRNRVQAESEMIQGDKHGNVSEVLSSQVVQTLKQNLIQLQAEYQEKLKLFKPAYPDMLSLAEQIKTVQDKLQNEVGNLKQSLQARYASSKKLEDSLRGEVAAYKSELVGLRDSSIEYNALKRDADTSRNLYDGLLQRMKEVTVASNATSSNIRIVDAAVPSDDIFRPKKSLNLIIGGLVGLMLGIGLALLRETLSQRIASVGELQALSGLPILGTIPHAGNLTESKLSLVAARGMGSAIAEAYRVATANLRFILPGGTPRITLMTSVNPAEGKSTSAVNIALSQAQMGMKVLLIDADLRRPSVHLKMGLPNSKGLSNYLGREMDIAAATQAFREVNGMYVITAGTLMADPVRMLSSPMMTQLMKMATQHFDSVIIDAPPVTGFADAILLSSLAQATVIVADQDHISRKQMLKTIEQLRRVKQNVVGFLLVKSQDDGLDDHYYDRYKKRVPTGEPKPARGKQKGLNLAPVG